MDSSQISTPVSSVSPVELALLPDFLSIRQIQNLSSDALKRGQKVNVVGFLRDVQPPIQSKGSEDLKCTFEFMDLSVQYESCGIKMNLFWLKENMPQFDGAGDAVLIRNAKTQMFQGAISLLSNYATELHVLPAGQIPTLPSNATKAAWRSYPLKRFKSPTAAETAYVAGVNERVEELPLPSTMEFQQKSELAMNVKDKFSVLKDVKDQGFYNILGEVIQVYDIEFDRVTVHLSDYTANSGFYNRPHAGGETFQSRDGDEHGYIKKRPKTVKDWPGPYGNMSIQLTLYDAHATFAREQVKPKDWVLLKNVQIKYGSMGGYLEGFLRSDRSSFEGKVQVEIMEMAETAEENDPRWREAVARKSKYEKQFKQNQQTSQCGASGRKRKREDGLPKNSKARRKQRRAVAEGKGLEMEQKVDVNLDLNGNIRCTNADQPSVLLSDILKPRGIAGHKERGQEYISPFDICNYKANLRVVDYFPPRIEDFAVGRRPSALDMLSDYSGGEDTDPEENMRAFRAGKGIPEKKWEWRFALQVVDASDKSAEKERIWLMISNYDAQMLFDMDATNLRKDKEALERVKEQLCILWGDLEEQKSALARANDPKTKTSSIQSKSMPPSSYMPGDIPPLDSDDEQENRDEGKTIRSRLSKSTTALSERNPNTSATGREDKGSDSSSLGLLQFRNKAFTCCIKQYGAKVDERDPALANAKDGKRWERKFGLFGTRIT